MRLAKDRLFLLQPDFEDPAYPGRRFYCWHCSTLEGVLSSFPALAEKIDVRRIAWPRPRAEVVDLLGEDNQSLPVLIIADGERSFYETGRHGGFGFVDRLDAILAVLSERHAIPEAHP